MIHFFATEYKIVLPSSITVDPQDRSKLNSIEFKFLCGDRAELFRLRTLESENMRLSATINTTNRQVDIRLNEIEQRLVEDESSPEESIEEEERNQESFI